jgi:hypothetical protein
MGFSLKFGVDDPDDQDLLHIRETLFCHLDLNGHALQHRHGKDLHSEDN